MIDFKNGKILFPIKEFLAEGSKYEINNIYDSATFFYRKENSKYQTLPLGSYEIIYDNNIKYLNILDITILSNAYSYQICYELDFEAVEILEDYPSMETMVYAYNTLVTDIKQLIEYNKKVVMVADDTQMSKVMSPLLPMTTWYMNEQGEIDTLPISDLFDKFDELVQSLYLSVEKLMLEKNQELEQSQVNLCNELKENLNSLGDELLLEYNNNHNDKLKIYNDNSISKMETFNTNYNSKFNAITDEGTKQLNLVNAAGATNLEAINTAGAAQKKVVTDEGAKQIELIQETGLGALQEDLSELQKDKLNKGEFLHPNILSAETLMFLSENNLGLKIAPNDFYIESETEKVQGNIYFSSNPNIKGAWEYLGGFEPSEEIPYLKELDGEYWKELSVKEAMNIVTGGRIVIS